MSKPATGRQVAVMPRTEVTLRLARKLAPHCAAAGIRIALVGPRASTPRARVVATIGERPGLGSLTRTPFPEGVGAEIGPTTPHTAPSPRPSVGA